MIILPFLSATLLRLKNKIATETIQLKLMRLAPPNTYPPMKFRQMELGIDFLEIAIADTRAPCPEI
jgi:hypothetical protein